MHQLIVRAAPDEITRARFVASRPIFANRATPVTDLCAVCVACTAQNRIRSC
jgi:hypothetical protein